MYSIKKYIFIILVLSFVVSNAQSTFYNGDPDASFISAREIAFAGNRAIARDTLKQILSKYPDYVDVHNLMAKTYSWDGDYDEARKHFNRITSKEKQNKDVWLSTIKNELYAENYSIAIGLSNKALLYLKEDAEILLLKQQAADNLNEPSKQQKVEEQGVSAMVIDSLQKNKIILTASTDVFDAIFDPMYNASISYSRETKYGTIIPRVNYSNRFQTNGVQFEVDAYPKFSNKTYAYLNYGFSDSEIFPSNRAGAELYVNLPKAIEVSGGIRYLDFKTNKVFIYTGSFGAYRGNYFFSLRPYITPSDNNKFNLSGSIIARRYLKDKYNYIGLNASYGVATDLKQFKTGDVVLAETLLYLESQQLLLEYQFTGKNSANVMKGVLGITRQEISFNPGNFFLAGTVGLTYEIKFK